MAEPEPSAGRGVLLAGAGSLLWVGLGLWAAARDGIAPAGLTPFEGLALASQLLVVPALLFAAAAALRRSPPVRPDPVEGALADGEALEARMTGLATRLSAVREQLAADQSRIEALSAGLEARAAETAKALTGAARAVEGAEAVGASLLARLADGRTATAGIEASLATLGAAAERLASLVADSGAASASLAEEVTARTARLGEAVAGLEQGATGARRETEAALALVAQATDEQAGRLAAATADARAQLSAIGAEAARALGRHLDGLVAQARELETRLAAQAGATETLAQAAEKGFQRLDARLEHSAATSASTLDQLTARLATVASAIDGLSEPVRGARGVVSDLAAAVETLEANAARTVASFAETLPERTDEARATAAELRQLVEGLVASLASASAQASGLVTPLREGTAALDAAAARFAAQRESISIAGEALVVELEQARQLIAEVERSTEESSIAAATRLVDALSRVREVAQAATGTMRGMLEGLVAEAEDALGTAADRALGERFTARIAAEAGEAEARAKAAAERSAASLAALAETLRLLDRKAEEKRTEMAVAAERDLLSASALVTERLAAESITLSAAMGQEMTADDWARWRRGERTLFGRRAVALLKGQDSTALRALAGRDPGFAGAASRLVAGMDALVGRLEAGGQADLARLVRDSDPGRLAAILSEALDG